MKWLFIATFDQLMASMTPKAFYQEWLLQVSSLKWTTKWSQLPLYTRKSEVRISYSHPSIPVCRVYGAWAAIRWFSSCVDLHCISVRVSRMHIGPSRQSQKLILEPSFDFSRNYPPYDMSSFLMSTRTTEKLLHKHRSVGWTLSAIHVMTHESWWVCAIIMYQQQWIVSRVYTHELQVEL